MSNSPTADAIAHLGKMGGVLSVTIKDVQDLQQTYMGYVRNGGLFVPTNKKYRMGDEVFMMVRLPQDDTRHAVVGKVVWVGHAVSAGRPAGVGLQFVQSKESEILRDQLEKVLIGVSPDKPTMTM